MGDELSARAHVPAHSVVVYKRGHADEVWAHFGSAALLDALTADDDPLPLGDAKAYKATAADDRDDSLAFLADEPLRGVRASTVGASVTLGTFLAEAVVPAGALGAASAAEWAGGKCERERVRESAGGWVGDGFALAVR